MLFHPSFISPTLTFANRTYIIINAITYFTITGVSLYKISAIKSLETRLGNFYMHLHTTSTSYFMRSSCYQLFGKITIDYPVVITILYEMCTKPGACLHTCSGTNGS